MDLRSGITRSQKQEFRFHIIRQRITQDIRRPGMLLNTKLPGGVFREVIKVNLQ